jgi:hypothetical protein
MATRRAGLRHPDLASRPCPNLLDRQTGPRVRGLHRLEEVQNVLCARGSPQSQKPMVGVRERPPAADGDEARVAVFWQDHGSTVPECICPTWPGAMLVVPDRDATPIARARRDPAAGVGPCTRWASVAHEALVLRRHVRPAEVGVQEHQRVWQLQGLRSEPFLSVTSRKL